MAEAVSSWNTIFLLILLFIAYWSVGKSNYRLSRLFESMRFLLQKTNHVSIELRQTSSAGVVRNMFASGLPLLLDAVHEPRGSGTLLGFGTAAYMVGKLVFGIGTDHVTGTSGKLGAIVLASGLVAVAVTFGMLSTSHSLAAVYLWFCLHRAAQSAGWPAIAKVVATSVPKTLSSTAWGVISISS